MLHAVLFEFDGVLADTRDARRRALLEALSVDGATIGEAEYDDRCAGLPVRSAVRAAFELRAIPADDTTIELAAARAERGFSSLVESGVSLLPGARALIESMQGQTRLGIVSRAARRDIEQTLAMARLDYAFEFVLSDDDPYPPKPSAEPYIGALKRFARRKPVDPKNVVALEDGVAGIRSAKDAGIRCAVVGELPLHLAMNADAMLPSLLGQTAASIDALTLGKRPAER
ncbi:MAG TPA: HAD family phosphatase [Gemmatimonadaceae bacterium]|nr:HAD family phosphatase [Gemmatimonadaceae bacterium]